MRILVIPDVHGTQHWKYIVNNEKYDLVVFLGDYWDSFTIGTESQINNFRDILQFKRDNPDKVILLMGNHDYHYMGSTIARGEYYSGFNAIRAQSARILVDEAVKNKEIVACAKIDKYLFTHAGLTRTWLASLGLNFNTPNLDKGLNQYLLEMPTVFQFNGKDGYGDNITQGPFWVRPRSLKLDSEDSGYVQVVGHTPQPFLDLTDLGYYFTDVLEHGIERHYLVIDNHDTIAVKIPDDYDTR